MSSPLATGRATLRVTGSLTRAMVDSARRVRPERGRVAKSVRIVVCVVGPLVLGLAIGHPEIGLALSFGGFAGFHGHAEPYPQRARLVAAMATGYVAAVMAGTLAQASPIVAVLVTGTFALSAAFVCQALALPAPREYMLVLICLLVGALPAAPAPPFELAGWTALGGAWAWLVLMSGWLTDRERPEREAVRAALRATIRLIGATPENRPARRHAAVLATRTARRSVEFAGGPTAPLLREVQLGAEDLLDRALVTRAPGEPLTGTHVVVGDGVGVPGRADSFSEPAAASRPFTVGDGVGVPGRTDNLSEPTAANRPFDDRVLGPDQRVALRREAGRLIERTDAALPAPGFRRAPRDPARPPLRSGLWAIRNALGAHSLVPPMALRFGIAVGAALALGFALGVPRPYWIPLTTAAVMQGATLLTTARRAIERAAGTAAGIFIAAAVVAVDPGSWEIALGVAVFLFLTEMTIAASYVVAVTFITPMTLLLGEIGTPGTLTDVLIGWRLVDTLIGCALGFAAGRLLWPSRARHQLDRALESALDGIDALLAVAAPEPSRPTPAQLAELSTTARWMVARAAPLDPAQARARRMAAGRGRRGRAAALRAQEEAAAPTDGGAVDRGALRARRHDLRVRLLNLRAVTDAALGDRFTSAPREDELWPLCAGVQQLGWTALGRHLDDPTELRRRLARLRGQLVMR